MSESLSLFLLYNWGDSKQEILGKVWLISILSIEEDLHHLNQSWRIEIYKYISMWKNKQGRCGIHLMSLLILSYALVSYFLLYLCSFGLIILILTLLPRAAWVLSKLVFKLWAAVRGLQLSAQSGTSDKNWSHTMCYFRERFMLLFTQEMRNYGFIPSWYGDQVWLGKKAL